MFKSIIVWAISAAQPESTVTLVFTNSGGEIQNLQIMDNVCNKLRFSGHFAASDATTINTFCVRDASTLATEIAINADGSDNSPRNAVLANSSVDVSYGEVTSP